MVLRLVSVSRRFGNAVGLDDVSLHVRRGDCYGFIGHNGAGKTTAMRIALGLHRPDAGRVIVDGFDAARHPREARARMGALIETPGFHARLSGEANLAVLSRLAGRTAAEARAEARRLIERVGLDHAAARHVAGYSQGMRQRLGIAQAMIGDPPILILDEPTNGLDPEGIAEIRELLRSLTRGDGRTVLVSSHQLAELSDVCNRVGVLRKGRLVVEDDTANLLAAGRRRYRIETRDRDRARRVLGGLGLEPDEDQRLELGAHAPEDVARALVEGDAGLQAFAPEPETLEEIYLRAAARESTDVPSASVEADSAATPTSGAPSERLAPAWPILRVVRYELGRWARGRTVPLLLLAPGLLGALAVGRRHAQALDHAREISGGELFSATGVTAFEGVGLALQAGLPLAALIVLGVASQGLAAELARGTLRNLLVRPVARWQLALGKGLAAVLLGLAGYAVLAASAVAAAASFFDFTDVVEVLPNGATFPMVAAEELWPELRRALLAPILPLCAFAALGHLASSLPRTGAAALGLGLAMAVALDLSRGILRELDVVGWVPSAYLPSPLGDLSLIQYYVDVSQGVSNAIYDLSPGQLVPLAWTVVCLIVAVLVLGRRSIP